MNNKKKLTKLLDEIAEKQKSVSLCRKEYLEEERDFEQKKALAQEISERKLIEKTIQELNNQYIKQSDLLFEDLNSTLIKGLDLSKEIGEEIAYDYKKLWDYMTQSMRFEVKSERVLKDIEYIKKDLSNNA
tara:strand:+ start:179 stop:571 length:393 start_codon:yes stop_codon:yes gene_type:complete